MSKRLIFWFIISLLFHFLLIISTTFLPVLFGFGGLQLSSDKSSGITIGLAEGDDIAEDVDKKEFEDDIIKHGVLNIQVVPRNKIEDYFNKEISKELTAMLNVIEEEKKLEENKKDIEISNAIEGTNIINTYPLQIHANNLLENFDFTKAFYSQITFKVNSDGSFRGIDVVDSSGYKIIDETLKNIFIEISKQKVSILSSFRQFNISVDSDGDILILTIDMYFKDYSNAQSIQFLTNTLLNSSKNNNKNNVETMTILNNLDIERLNNILKLSITADTKFVKEAIKD